MENILTLLHAVSSFVIYHHQSFKYTQTM